MKLTDFTREEIDEALSSSVLEEFNANGRTRSRKYDLIYEGKKVPVKNVFRAAFVLAGVSRNEIPDFGASPSKDYLIRLGYSVVDAVSEQPTASSILKEKFNSVWRCADSYKWDQLKDLDLLSFDWLDKDKDYTSMTITGSGKTSIRPWVQELKKGDLIFVMGKNSYHGVAVAETEYDFSGPFIDLGGIDRPAIKIKYLHKLDQPISHGMNVHNNPGSFSAIDKWSFGLDNTIAFLEKTFPDVVSTITSSYPSIASAVEDDSNLYAGPLNQILYGPPGTGKTRKTIELAAALVSDVPLGSYQDALQVFNDNLHDRIEFVTFHQNYSYEDFVQGLRPDIDSGTLSFDREDGIFTRMCVEALFEYYKVYKTEEASSTADLEDIYLDFVTQLKEAKERVFKSATGLDITLKAFTKNNNLEFGHKDRSRKYLVSGKRLIKLFNKFPKISDVKNVHQDIRDAIGGCNTTVYWVALHEFIKFYNSYGTGATVESIDDYEGLEYTSKKDLLESIDTSLLRSVDSSAVPKYIMVIDEINRANISRVFGELITLLEKDKRSHGDIALSCKLPSGETLIVPSNLYIIGTMNTADKSIALLDVALRRRFEFVPMYPKYDRFADGVEMPDREILEALNDEIAKDRGKGPDFTIGHSYFLSTPSQPYDRATAFNNKVIPLLMEYYRNSKPDVVTLLHKAAPTLEFDDVGFVLRLKE